jgi:hypothetical protein
MNRNFVGMAIVAPVVFSVLIFVVSLVVFRLFFCIVSKMIRKQSPNQGVQATW